MNLSLPKTFTKFLFIVLLFVGQISFAQTTIENQTFRGGSLPSGWSQTSVTFSTSGGGFANFTLTSAVLVSPVYDLTGYTDVKLSFSVAKFGTGGDGPVTIDVSNDGGTTWTAQTFNSATPTTSTYLNTVEESITVTGSTVRIRITRVNSPSQKRFRDYLLEGTLAPSGPTVTTTAATAISTTGADLNGTINANGTTTDASFEYGTTVAYGDTATATPSTATGTTDTSISATIGSLSVNTLYHYRAVGTVGGVPTNGNDLTFYTLAATPGVVVVNNPLQTTLDVTVNATTENGNPATTEYAIQETGGQYVQADGTLGATAIWQTASVWATTTVTGLTTATTYTFQAIARNGANVETIFGGSASETTLAAQLVDYAVVQFPKTTQTILEGGSLTVYIRAYEPGLTTLSGEQANLFGWVGYSSTNDDPSNMGWTWVSATFNVEVGNDDEYQATLSGLPIGTYYYAARFQIGTGPFVYGGSAGVWNNDNVTLNVNADVVDFANIQFPTSATITEGETETVFAQVYEPGVTEGVGQGAGITAEIGYSSTDTTPDGTWTWLSATHNATVTGNNDEYQVNLGTGLAPGTYYYASRFIKAGSSTYVYGGTAGVWNNDSGVLTIEALGTPVATAASAIGLTSFTANWDAVDGATSYEIDVYTVEAGSVITDDFGFEGTISFPTGWTGTGYVQNAVANANSGTYFAGLNATAKYIRTDLISNPTSLSFYYRYSSATANNTVVVQVSQDGTTWDDYETYVATGSGSSTTYNVSNITLNLTGDYYVQWIMTARSGGSFYFDDVTILSGSPDVQTPVVGSPFTVTSPSTSYEVTGLNPETTYFYVVRAILGATTSANSNEIEVTTLSDTCTWNGTAWSNGTGPTFEIDAILEGAYDTSLEGGFTAKSLTVSTGGSLSIGAETSVTVVNALTNELTAAEVVINSDGSLIQQGTTNTNSGDVTVFRNSQDVMRLDYTMWSSPVAAQNLGGFSPDTMTNRFYTYTTETDIYTTIANTNDFAVGQGYLIRTPNNHPTSPTSWSGQFIGLPNSGDLSIGLSTGGNGYNLVGNPYPSPISISTLLTENNGVIGGNLYFWRKTNGATGSAYITYSGGTFSDGPHVFNNIQPGQGFIVQAVSGADLSFANTQRQSGNGVFYRNGNTTQSEDNSRIWLNVSANNAVIGQMAIGYNASASNDLDASDAPYINDNAVALNSFVANTELAVQHRAGFVATDVVPLSFKTTTAGSYAIAINAVDGLFTNEEQSIFLKDNLLAIEHDLRSSSYSFTTEAGSFTNRFEIVYESTLSVANPNFENGVVVYSKNKSIEINSGLESIATVRVVDIRGSVITEMKSINSNTLSIPLADVANQVLIVQITGINGQTISKKVVH